MNRISGGIVGLTGFIGQHHLASARSVISPRIDIDACVPGTVANFEQGKKIAESMGFESKRIYSTLGEMLDKENGLDFVLIATPNDCHLDQCLEVAKACINLVCDKPLARSRTEALSIVDAVEVAGIANCVTATYCGHAANIEARHRISLEGNSLNVRGGTCRYFQRWLRKPLADITPDEGGKQAAWRRDPARSGKGGAAGDILSHLIHQVIFITGLKVASVNANRRFVVEGVEAGMTDDEVVAVLYLDNGAEITCKAMQYAGGHQNDNDWELNLTDGISYGWNQRESEFLWTSEGGPRILLTRDDFRSPIIGATRSMPSLHVDGWHDANARLLASFAWDITGEAKRELFHPTVRVGAMVNAIIDAVITSADDGPFAEVQVQEIDPEPEMVSEGDGAD